MKRWICKIFGHRMLSSNFYNTSHIMVCGRCITQWYRPVDVWGRPCGEWVEIKL